MDRKIRVGAVSYLNTKPLLYGIEQSDIIHRIELKIDYPSRIADMLLSNTIDIGLVPVSIIPLMREYYINTNYCIGCNGPVGSVCLFSEVPLGKIRKVLLDYQSRTSVELAKILFKEYWKIHPELIDAGEDFRKDIRENVAGVIIGDRALEQRVKSTYKYDLGEAWKNLTGLPFVFAAWISNKKLDDSFITQFNEANSIGAQNINEVLKQINYSVFDLHEYYTRFIRYDLDDAKRKGMDLFLEKLGVPNRMQ